MEREAIKGTPAVLGGAPVFDGRVQFARPLLPAFDALEGELKKIINSGTLTKGPYLAEFEHRIAEHAGVREAVAVSSCTAGLMLIYQATTLRGEVVVPSFTFMATVHALQWNGLVPAFADVDPETWTLDPARLEEALTPQTSGIVATHTFGNPCDVEGLEAVANRHGLPLIFDAAHGFGSLLNGRPLGAYGTAEVFSMSPTKLLITGEGGVVTTDDVALARKVRVGREYGNRGDYDSEFVGMNARMPEFAALLGLHSLRQLEDAVSHRNAVVERYQKRLSVLPGLRFQRIQPGGRSSYTDCGILVEEAEFGLSRDMLATALGAEGVETRKYFEPPMHRHAMHVEAWGRVATERLPVTERISRQCLHLPLYSDMEWSLVDRICGAVERIESRAVAIRRRLSVGVAAQDASA